MLLGGNEKEKNIHLFTILESFFLCEERFTLLLKKHPLQKFDLGALY